MRQVMKASPVRLNPNCVAAMAKFVEATGAKEYLTEFMDWHACTINPRELTISYTWWEVSNYFSLLKVITL